MSRLLKTLSTIAQIGDLVTSIGGERVDNWVLVSSELDPHSYEIVKGDGEKLTRADLVFYNGLGLEHGASLSSFLRSSPKAIAIGDEIRRVSPEMILQRGEVVDPHVWMDVSLWKQAVGCIAKKLIEMDPEGASYYLARSATLEEELEKTHLYIRNLLGEIPSEKRFLVTSHDAFRYFARTYLIEPGESDWSLRLTAPEGLAPDGQLNPVDIQRVIDFLKSHRIQVVFPESNVSRDAVVKIASASQKLGFNVKVCKISLCGDSTGGFSYPGMMRHNAEVISQFLQE